MAVGCVIVEVGVVVVVMEPSGVQAWLGLMFSGRGPETAPDVQ